jgi:hypothetical protein
MSVVFAKIQMRRGTAAEWAAANPILAQGELAFETDTRVTKIGDGATGYLDLPAYATHDQMVAALADAQAARTGAETAGSNAAAAQGAAETARDEARDAVASLVQIVTVAVLDSAASIPEPPASGTLYLIRA